MALIFNGVSYPVDFIARHCGRAGWLGLIVVHLPGGEQRETWRQCWHVATRDEAITSAAEAWEFDETGAIREFKRDADSVLA